ncbi:MAG TPA: class I SAM-dependent methyltransferase [Solirubrobacteraceae bacterium]|nr:class I SAM-dependent methyltransferase [Solirubrobacteraceae bacterium]
MSVQRARELIPTALRRPLGAGAVAVARPLGDLRAKAWSVRGFRFGHSKRAWGGDGWRRDCRAPAPTNALEAYFDAHTAGPGIWKWRHYFEIYHRHLARFRNLDTHIVEVGVFSGGSLEMWRDYLGPACHVYGVDIEPACTKYDRPGIKVFIGDQADPRFWREFLAAVGRIDVVVDDGGHLTRQQVTTFEAVFGALSPGGVYICEDVHGTANGFHHYICGLSRNLNAWGAPTELQRMLDSIHMYPFMTVVEKRRAPRDDLQMARRGTQWQPFGHAGGVSVIGR